MNALSIVDRLNEHEDRRVVSPPRQAVRVVPQSHPGAGGFPGCAVIAADGVRFAALLTEAVHAIKRREGKPVSVIHDELGYALGKQGGSMVEHWRKGHVPVRLSDVETLARMLVERGGMGGAWLAAFRTAAGFGGAAAGCCGCCGCGPVRPGGL